MIKTNLTQRDFEEIERVHNEQSEIKHQIGEIEKGLSYVESVFKEERYLTLNRYIGISCDDQFVVDFGTVLATLKERYEKKISGLTLTLGGGDEA